MSGPIHPSQPPDGPQIYSCDLEARAMLGDIRRALLGDLATQTPGMLERQRKIEATVEEHTERLERHSGRILKLEGATAKGALAVLTAIGKQLLTALVGGILALIGWAATAPKPPRLPHP